MSILMKCKLYTLVISLLWSGSFVMGADDSGTDTVTPKISVVRDEEHPNDPINMGSEIVINVMDLTKWLAPGKKDLSDLVVYLNDVPIKNIAIRAIGNDRLGIRLRQTSQSKAEWSQLLGRPTQF